MHNLEHGGIFIQYGPDVPQSTIDQLQGFYDQHRNGTLLAPLPSLGSDIALGVWTTKGPSSRTTARRTSSSAPTSTKLPTLHSSRRTSSAGRSASR